MYLMEPKVVPRKIFGPVTAEENQLLPDDACRSGERQLTLLEEVRVGVEEKVVYEREQPEDTVPRFERHVLVGIPSESADAFGESSKAAGKHFWRKRFYVPIQDPKGLYVAEGVKIGDNPPKGILIYPPSILPSPLDGQRPDVAGRPVGTWGHRVTPTSELSVDGVELNAVK